MPLLRYKVVGEESTLDLFNDEVESIPDTEFFRRTGVDEVLEKVVSEVSTVGLSLGYRHAYPIYDTAHLSRKVSEKYAADKDKSENLERYHKTTFKRL